MEVRDREKWKTFATFERSECPSKSETKDWSNEKYQRGIKEVP